MTNKEAVNWIINLSADIGKSEHSELWHYEQALYEIREILESAQRWIPVTERLPEDRGRYICYISNEYIITCKWYPDIKAWFPDYEYAGDDVKAWMPLPEPYEWWEL